MLTIYIRKQAAVNNNLSPTNANVQTKHKRITGYNGKT